MSTPLPVLAGCDSIEFSRLRDSSGFMTSDRLHDRRTNFSYRLHFDRHRRCSGRASESKINFRATILYKGGAGVPFCDRICLPRAERGERMGAMRGSKYLALLMVATAAAAAGPPSAEMLLG